MKKILVINGPNLNLLGDREPEIYGRKTLQDIESECRAEFSELDLIFYQSNSESEIIEQLHSCNQFSALIINAGAFTHTSIAIHDALKAVKIPKIEVLGCVIFAQVRIYKIRNWQPLINPLT